MGSPSRFRASTVMLFGVLLVGTILTVWGCSAERGSTGVEAGGAAATAASAGSAAALSFEQAWAASLAALDNLGPTRVRAVETTEGLVTGDDVPFGQSHFGPQTEEVEQVFDIPRGRAKLTEHTSDRMVTTIIAKDKERTTVTRQPLSNSEYVSISRYISLEAPSGLPLPLWAGQPAATNRGYADLFPADDSGITTLPGDGKVERQEDGALRLSWEREVKGAALAASILLGPDHLPLRIEITGRGTPEEGELQGLTMEYSTDIAYEYEQVASFSEADFAVDVPAGAFREGVTYELALDSPWSAQADWGQYWLGDSVQAWRLTGAEHVVYEDDPDPGSGAEPGDEVILLRYTRPEAASPNEDVQVMVRPLRGRYYHDSLTSAEQRVAAGLWVRAEMTVAGKPATVISGSLEGGADDRIDSIYVFLPDAFVNIQVWAPVDPLRVLQALRPVGTPGQ